MLVKPLPRYVIAKPLASGLTGFYFTIPTKYRKLCCTISNQSLGTDYETACGENGAGGRAEALNQLFDEWNKKKLGQEFPPPAYTDTAPLTGYSGNTNRAKHILKRSRSDHVLTTNAPC